VTAPSHTTTPSTSPPRRMSTESGETLSVRGRVDGIKKDYNLMVKIMGEL
jgi:hypothetical protein